MTTPIPPHILSNEELNELEDELPKFIRDPVDIELIITQAELDPAEILKLGMKAPQIWHHAVRYALSHRKLPEMLSRVNVRLGDRQDADQLRRLIALVTQRKASAVLAEEVQRLKSQANQLLDEPEADVAALAALQHIRPPVRHILEQLNDERFWPTIVVVTDEGAQVARALLVSRCLDALRTIYAVIKLSRLAGTAPSSDADDRDRWRLEKAQSMALLDAKFALAQSLLTLHQELIRRLPLPTGDYR